MASVAYEMNLIKLMESFHCDDRCRAYLEKLRWPDGVHCPRCKATKVYEVKERGQYDCDSCRYQFSVTSGTIMHDTHLPIHKWFLAVYMMVESEKSISANQLKRTLDIAYRTAWYLCHRIRKSLQSPQGLLLGVVEVDEKYMGGKPRNKGPHNKRGLGSNKHPVMGAIERGGELRAAKVNKPINRKTLRQFILENVADDAKAIYTDDNPTYGNLTDHNTAHETVNHSAKEWVRGEVHTNTIESAFALWERAFIGAYHKISVKHLDLYIDEFEFRFNHRNNPYIFRDAMKMIVMTTENLEYKELVA